MICFVLFEHLECYNKKYMESLFNLIKHDLDRNRPETTMVEVQELLRRGMALVSHKQNVEVLSKSEITFSTLKDLISNLNLGKTNLKKGFLWRPLCSGAPMHQEIPSDFDIFFPSTVK